MLDDPFKSASAIAADIREGRIGCLEVLDGYWDRVNRHNPRLNAIVVSDIEEARGRARLADEALRRGENRGPLHGVPMTLKESFDVAGMPTTWGIAERKGEIAKADSVVTQRLRDAGAIIFGKTNVPVLLAEWQTNNPIYGATHNPWDVSLSPGGSSGGSAAALAAGLTALEVGSDIGASIRNPAHYCGVYGHKPTYGLVPLRGQLLSGNIAPVDFFVAGPLARSARDLQLELDVIAGPDTIEAEGWRLELPAPKKRRLAEFKVAVMLDDPNSAVDTAVKDGLQRLADFLARSGATVSDTARPDFDTTDAHRTFITLLRAATSRAQTAEAFRRNAAAAAAGESDDSYFGRMVRANTMLHKDWLDVDEARHRLRYRWQAFFGEYDFLLCPAAASAAHAPNHVGERHLRTIAVDGKQVSVIDQLFWAGIASVANLPATVAPVGLTPAGLPTGVQIIGPEFHDRSCIAFADLLEKEFRAFVPPPGFDS